MTIVIKPLEYEDRAWITFYKSELTEALAKYEEPLKASYKDWDPIINITLESQMVLTAKLVNPPTKIGPNGINQAQWYFKDLKQVISRQSSLKGAAKNPTAVAKAIMSNIVASQAAVDGGVTIQHKKNWHAHYKKNPNSYYYKNYTKTYGLEALNAPPTPLDKLFHPIICKQIEKAIAADNSKVAPVVKPVKKVAKKTTKKTAKAKAVKKA